MSTIGTRLPKLTDDRLQAIRIGLTVLTVLIIASGIVGFIRGDGGIWTQIFANESFGPIYENLNVSLAVYGTFLETLSIVGWAITICIALIILWRSEGEYITLITAAALLLTDQTGASFSLTTDPIWGIPTIVISALAAITWSAFLFTFPNGRFNPRWSQWIFAFGVLSTLLLHTYQFLTYLNVGDLPKLSIDSPTYLLYSLSISAVYIGAAIVQLHRYRTLLNDKERAQTRWILAALGGFVLLFFLNFFLSVVWGLTQSTFAGYALLTAWGLLTLSTAIFAVAVAIAVTRYNLWNVDFVINRGIVYGALTIGLLIVFALGFLPLRAVLNSVIGTGQDVVAAVIAVGIVAGAFNPARDALRRFVDKKLYGIGIDYAAQPRRERSSQPDRTEIGRYRHLVSIGSGGMAEVYLADDTTNDQRVALKVLPGKLAQEENFRRRFEREGRTAAALDHPNIIDVYDYGEIGGTYYIAMAYIDGVDLSARIKQEGALPLTRVIPILEQVTDALDYAHAQHIVHRDIKPSNVMLEGDRAVLMDFGIAKIITADTRLTATGMLGTFDYMAPEQIQASGEVDKQADIYALGVMAYEMLTGQKPYPNSNPGAVLIAHLQAPVPDPRDVNPAVSAGSAAAVMRAMAKDPAQRFESAGAFVKAMHNQQLGAS